MVAVVKLKSFGGPDNFSYEQADVATPSAGEVRIRHQAIGLNYTDILSRVGRAGMTAPLVLGAEGAGDIVAVGPGVTEFKKGDRVAYTGGLGAYAEERLYPADRIVKIPDAMSYEIAASIMLKGLTAWYLIRKTYPVGQDTVALLHAAAGGVGLILAQWAAHLGAIVIGTVGTADKAKIAQANGCKHSIVYTSEDFVARVKEITSGKLCHVVYDSIGRSTYPGSIDCLRPRGMFVSFGNASGPIEHFDFNSLGPKGGLFTSKPMLPWYVQTREDLLEGVRDLFEVVQKGIVKISINHRYALKDVAHAHRDLEGRKTTGSAVLIP